MNTSFTPGPWKVSDIGFGSNIEPSIAWIGYGSSYPKDEHKANARLIAAAPELLQALFRIYDEDGLTGQNRIDFIEDIARAAINLATGQEP